ncbi:MAG: solute:sodium symporter family transporter [Victivallaceae bacterium]|nr:solute:sodium symporter family transporter [Victivallaceae bacterium]
MSIIAILSFLAVTGLVALGTWLLTRKSEHTSKDGFFLAGRTLTFPVIAGSLLLTNLSTEQMVGLNGSAYASGLAVMAWEVIAVVALVLMAMIFLPKFLKAGITTVPQYLEQRFDRGTELFCNVIFLLAYAVILVPIILYTGAQGMIGILGLENILSGTLGIVSEYGQLFTISLVVAVIGSLYALWGGLNSCAVSDTLNGIGLLIGGFLITYFAFVALGGESGMLHGINIFMQEASAAGRLNSVGANNSEVPFWGLFSGILFINVFYWCTNQQIIQRTLGAKSLAEGQKGVLLTGFLKLIGPLYLVIPGLIAFVMAMDKFQLIQVPSSDKAYGALVAFVLPKPLLGFFAAVLLGAILSSFNSVLNSTCTMFSLGIYQRLIDPNAEDRKLVAVGRWFGLIMTVVCIFVAPLLCKAGGIFNYLQTMNALYFIPILAVVLVGMFSKHVPACAAKTALALGILLIGLGYFVHPFSLVLQVMSQYYFVALVFVFLIVLMLVIGKISPRATAYVAVDAKATDLTPWAGTPYVSAGLILIVVAIYWYFADFSIL